MEGKAIIFSAPSGSGKTTIVHHLLQEIPTLSFSISATTRKKRPNEINGKDYYFLSTGEFRNKILHGELLEWEEVYTDTFYGTLKEEVERIWSDGMPVIFDVDVKGGINLKKALGAKALSIFVKVPNIKILGERLRSRSTEDEKSLKLRIDKATEEMKEETNFDKIVVNDDLDAAVRKAKELVVNFIKI